MKFRKTNSVKDVVARKMIARFEKHFPDIAGNVLSDLISDNLEDAVVEALKSRRGFEAVRDVVSNNSLLQDEVENVLLSNSFVQDEIEKVISTSSLVEDAAEKFIDESLEDSVERVITNSYSVETLIESKVETTLDNELVRHLENAEVLFSSDLDNKVESSIEKFFDRSDFRLLLREEIAKELGNVVQRAVLEALTHEREQNQKKFDDLLREKVDALFGEKLGIVQRKMSALWGAFKNA